MGLDTSLFRGMIWDWEACYLGVFMRLEIFRDIHGIGHI